MSGIGNLVISGLIFINVYVYVSVDTVQPEAPIDWSTYPITIINKDYGIDVTCLAKTFRWNGRTSTRRGTDVFRWYLFHGPDTVIIKNTDNFIIFQKGVCFGL